jgi:hypothetical protein
MCSAVRHNSQKAQKSHKQPPWITMIVLFNVYHYLASQVFLASRKGFNSPGQYLVETQISLSIVDEEYQEFNQY